MFTSAPPVDERPHDLAVAFAGGEHERRETAHGGDVALAAFGRDLARALAAGLLLVALAHRDDRADPGGEVRPRLGLEQGLHGVEPALRGGEHERRLAVGHVGGVDVGAPGEDEPDGVGAAGSGGEHQRRRAVGVGHDDVGPASSSSLTLAASPARAAIISGVRPPRRDGRVHVGAGAEQQPHQLGLAVVGGPVQGRAAVALGLVHVGLGGDAAPARPPSSRRMAASARVLVCARAMPAAAQQPAHRMASSPQWSWRARSSHHG